MATLNIITLAQIKKQCRVDYDDQDDMLTMYGVAAENVVVTKTRRTVAELTTMGGGEFPTELKVAMLILTATYFKQPEAVSSMNMTAVPYLVDDMVKPYVKLSDRTES